MKLIIRSKIIPLVLVFLLLCTSFVPGSAFAESKNTDSEYAFIPYTAYTANASLNLVYAGPDVVGGPMSFAINESGEIFILDSDAYKVNVYTSEGAYVKTISLAADMFGRDIETDGTYLYIMCDNDYIYKRNISDENSKWAIVSSWDLAETAQLIQENGRVWAKAWEGSDTYLGGAAPEFSEVQTHFAASADATAMMTSSGMTISKNNESIQVQLSGYPVGTYILKSIDDISYIMEQEALFGCQLVETRVGRYHGSSLQATAMPVQLSQYEIYIPFKYLYLSDDGVLYQMIPKEDGVSIYIVPWSNGRVSNITEDILALDRAKLEQMQSGTNIMTSSTSVNGTRGITAGPDVVSASTALVRARAMCNVNWQYDASEHFTPTTSTTQSPIQLTSTTDCTAKGLPYCWGMMNGLDTANFSGYRNFLTALSDGKTAGNINTADDDGVSSTAGVDCAGFVCAAYKFEARYGTSILNGGINEMYSVAWSSVQAGDIAVKRGHTYLVEGFVTLSSGQIVSVKTLESTNLSGFDGATSYTRSYATTMSEYNLYRMS